MGKLKKLKRFYYYDKKERYAREVAALLRAFSLSVPHEEAMEIKEEVGDDNIFIFGLTAEQVQETKRQGYKPSEYCERNPALKKILDMISGGYFSPPTPDLFKGIVDNLLQSDPYMLLADFDFHSGTYTYSDDPHSYPGRNDLIHCPAVWAGYEYAFGCEP